MMHKKPGTECCLGILGGPIILVDDDQVLLEMVALTLAAEGITNLRMVADSSKVMDLVRAEGAALVLLDMVMPGLSGLDLLPLLRQEFPSLPVVMVTALSDVDTVVTCMKNGAYDYLLKPVEPSRLIACVRHALRQNSLQAELTELKERLLTDCLNSPEAFTDIKTCSKKMRAVFQYAEVVAKSSQPVLVTGETGTGKELMAHALHRLSGVQGKFIAVNVAGLDDSMFSDSLFGHRKGAFTGADQNRDGLIRQAAGGTLFLDEIGDLAPVSQVKLLRLLQEREYFPCGSDAVHKTDARIIVATNRNLSEAVQAGQFRSDLFYRLCAHTIALPPLRERRDDIALLVHHFIDDVSRMYGKSSPPVSAELLARLRSCRYPGNIRELQALVYDAMARHTEGALNIEHVPTLADVLPHQEKVERGASALDFLTTLFGHFPTIHEMQEYLIDEALHLAQGNSNGAASLLGITRQTIANHMKIRKLKDTES